MRRAHTRAWRLLLTSVVSFVLLTTIAGAPARAAPTVYTFSMTYQGTCEGFSKGEIRVDGATVELWGSDGKGVQKLGSTTREPDDTFTFAIPNSGFTMTGKLSGDAVSGSGTYSAFGSNCPFTFNGSVVGAPTTTTLQTTTTKPDALDDVPEVEFDPSQSGPLSVGELRNMMRRAGADDSTIKSYFRELDREATRFAGDLDARVRTIAAAVGQLARLTKDGRPLFPTLETLLTMPPNCDNCTSVLGRLARDLTEESGDPGSILFHRLIRVSVAVDL